MYSYAPSAGPISPWRRLWLRLSAARRRWRERGDGRDYTGWRARVLVDLPGQIGDLVTVGDVGVVAGTEHLPDQPRRVVHRIDFDRVTLVLPLPSRDVELIGPSSA